MTALFYDSSKTSQAVVNELETIDDEADVFRIRFVKIRDAAMAQDRFSLGQMPKLVYFRRGVPIVYHGDLTDEPEVLLLQTTTIALLLLLLSLFVGYFSGP